MQSNTTNLMINESSCSHKLFDAVPADQVERRRELGWASVLLSNFVYQQRGSELRIAVTNCKDPSKVSIYTKPVGPGGQTLAQASTIAEFEKACREYFTNNTPEEAIVQLWKNRDSDDNRARVLATFHQNFKYDLPPNYEWLVVDMEVFDLREQLQDYLESGCDTPSVDLGKMFTVHRDLIARFILMKLSA